MKKKILAFTLAAGVIALSACNNNSDNVMESKAGNISKDEFYEVLKDQNGAQALEQLVYTKILADKFDVEKELDERVEQAKTSYGENFEYLLMSNGFKGEEDYRDFLEYQLLLEKAVLADITASDEEINQYYEYLKKDVTARQILTEDEATAKEALDRLNKGEDFAKLAAEYNIDGTKSTGGDLGVLDPASYVNEFLAAAYQLDVNEVSEIVKSEFGFHIIEVTKVEEKEVEPLEDMKAEIERNVKMKKVTQENYDAALKKVVDEADVKINDTDLKDLFASTK